MTYAIVGIVLVTGGTMEEPEIKIKNIKFISSESTLESDICEKYCRLTNCDNQYYKVTVIGYVYENLMYIKINYINHILIGDILESFVSPGVIENGKILKNDSYFGLGFKVVNNINFMEE